MYKDYYLILEVHYTATQDEIKRKYRQLAKKWHPDINKSEDATSKMQDITEAYLILNNCEARRHYDSIHEFYFRQKKSEQKESHSQHTHKAEQFTSDNFKQGNKTKQTTSEPNDPILDDWILKAKQQAKEFVLQSIRDAKGITVNGCKYTAYSIGVTIILFVAILVLILIWAAFQ